jgi:hypothetical protein
LLARTFAALLVSFEEPTVDAAFFAGALWPQIADPRMPMSGCGVFESLLRQIVVRNFQGILAMQDLRGASCLDRPARMNDNGCSAMFDTVSEFLGKGPLIVLIE